VKARIDGKVRHCLLDSGADVSIIPTNFVVKSEITKNEHTLHAANNTEISVEGSVSVPIAIDRLRFRSTLLVSPNVDEVILGRDWLCENKVAWDFGAHQLTIHGNKCTLRHRNVDTPRLRRCRASSDVHVPPSSEVIIPADVVYSNLRWGRTEDQWVTVPSEPVAGLRIARVLLPDASPTVAVRICNITKHAIDLKKGQALSHLQTVNVVSAVNNGQEKPTDAAAQRKQMLERVDPSLPPSEKQQLERLLESYSDVFSYSEFDLGHTNIVSHEINTEQNTPFRQPLRPQPRAYLPVIDNLVNEMQQQGVIEPSQSDWASNIVLVKKKDGTIRFCVDYRQLNNLTKKDAYPLPRIDTCLDTLSGAVWYSTFDLRSGFHQVTIRPEDANKTTFVCHKGTYRFPRMPFGLCNAPATFQRLMDTVLAGLNFDICLVYLDDIILFSRTLTEHMERLGRLFKKLREANLKLKPSKCHLLQTKVTFLGYTISQDGVGTDPGKIEAVRDWPTPTNLRQCRAFVGLCQYYRRFVPNFSAIAAPLYNLTKKGAHFVWSRECQSAFDSLKSSLIGAEVLRLPDEEGLFILDCDASDQAIGAVLSQVQNGEERPVCYASQLYDKHQKNYNVTRKELLALVTFVKKFRQYLLGRKFLIRTDHAALQWLRRTPEPIGQQARWLEILEEFDFDIQHRAGTKHCNADALSRSVGAVTNSQDPPPLRDPTDWPDLQRRDPDVGFIYGILESGGSAPDPAVLNERSAEVKTLCSQFALLTISPEGILCRKFYPKGSASPTLQKIVPACLRDQIASELHKGLNGGHLGNRRAKAQLQKRFYWPGWSTSVRLAKRRCPQCARYQRPQPRHQGELQPLISGEPWERVSIDVTGPHPVSSKGNVYILTVIDHFTKWAEIFPMRNQEAHTVAKLLVDRVFCVHGCPIQILSDRGPNFESELFKELCQRLAIDKIRTTAYQPSTNGAIERFHATMHSLLARWVSDNHRDWDEKLPAVAFAYRTSVHESTGLTPFSMVMGREARIPADLVYGPPPSEPQNNTDFVERQQAALREAFQVAREQLGKALIRRKHQYDLRARPTTFPVGTQVWYLLPRRRQGRYKKWQSFYEGPFTVTEVLGPVTYKIQKGPQSRPLVVHVDKLKTCHEPEISKPNQVHARSEDTGSPGTRPKRTTRRPARYL